MSDLLDHVSPEPGSHRAPRRLPKGVVLLALAVVLAVLAGGGVYAYERIQARFASAPDFSGEGTGEVVVQVKPGETAAVVARTLAAAGVVKSAEAFRSTAANDPESVGLQPGFYRLRLQMSAKSALALLLDPAARLRGRVTIPEGSTVGQTLTLIAKNTEVPLAELKKAAARPAALGLPPYAKNRLEGFLFPATYDIDPGTTATEVLSLMVERFNEAAQAVALEPSAKALGLTPYEVVIVASLIEREVRFDDEYPRVAQVVYNRLKQGERIDIDASVLFGLGRTSGGLTRSDLQSDSPYNLRRFKGLPPGPIASPGEATLRGALNPSGGDELFYVLGSKDGRSVFTTNLRDHNRAVAKARAEGVF